MTNKLFCRKSNDKNFYLIFTIKNIIALNKGKVFLREVNLFKIKINLTINVFLYQSKVIIANKSFILNIGDIRNVTRN